MMTFAQNLLRYLALCVVLACGVTATAQETAAPDADVDEPVAPDTAAESDEEEPDLFDDPALDEQTYEEDEDVFVPSEEIPSDEPIPFPTNI